MAIKNQALTVNYFAWNSSTGAGQAGDAANHSVRGVGDGTIYTPAASPAEVDATNFPGLYKIALAAGETNYNFFSVGGKSSTANVQLIPIHITTERGVVPNVAPAVQGAPLTVGTGAGQANPDGTGAVPVAFGTALPTAGALVAASVGEALYYADMVGGRRNTAQGGTATTIVLDSAASAVDGAYKDHAIRLIGGTGSGQYATIIGYAGTTKVASIWRPGAGNNWTTTPDGTTQFVTIPCPAVDVSGFLGTPVTVDGNGYPNVNARDYGGTVVTGGLPNTVTPLTGAAIATAVWQDATAGDFTVTNSAGAKLAAAGSAGDPWATALPGAYGAGTAGNIVGTNLNATITSRMATFAYTAPPTATAVAAAVLTDTTDTGTAGSLGHLIGTAPSWYAAPPTPPTAAQIATGVWQDTTAGDFAVGGSAGAKLLALAAGVTVTTNNDKAGYGLAATGLDAIVIEAGINMAQAQSLILAACAGIVSGAGTGTITIKGAGGTTTRILATVDSLGDRSALTLTPPSI